MGFDSYAAGGRSWEEILALARAAFSGTKDTKVTKMTLGIPTVLALLAPGGSTGRHRRRATLCDLRVLRG
jgi:hypothetical protein